MNRRIFLSLPITGIDRQLVAETNNLMKQLARSMGMQPVSPLDILPASVFSSDNDDAWRQAMIITYPELLLCNSIMIASGWEKSDGCTIEELTARLRDYNIIYLNVFRLPAGLKLSFQTIIKSKAYENDFVQSVDSFGLRTVANN